MIVRQRLQGFGSLPKADSLVSGDVTGDGLNGLGPGNRWVADFQNRYAKAMTLSGAAEKFEVGSSIRTLGKTLDAKLTKALQDVQTYYLWDTGIFGRSATQAANLVSALQAVNKALNYDKLEIELRQAAAIMAAEQAAMEQATGASTVGPRAEGPPKKPSVLPTILMFGIPAAVLLVGGLFMLLKKPKVRPAPTVAGYGRARGRRKARR